MYKNDYYSDYNKRSRRKRYRKKIKTAVGIAKIISMIMLIAAMFAGLYYGNRIINGEDTKKDGEVVNNLIADVSEKENIKVNEILAHKEEYPTELLELLSRNPETIDFVYDYPANKDKQFDIDISGDITGDRVPLFIQWDERWGYQKYGDSIIAINGCGPTCLSMVASYLLKDSKLNPQYMAQFSEDNGYISENGTLWALLSTGARKLGLESIEIPLDEDRVMNNLEVGNLIICSMGPGDFTTEGHFIVLAGCENGKIIVNDPNSRKNSERLWEFKEIKNQIKNIWVFR